MRARLEQVLRGIVIIALAVMLWQSLRQQSESGGQVVRARDVGRGALAKWSSLANAPAAIQLALDSVPSPIARAWLGALVGAGSKVAWSGDLPPLMIDAQPVASPVTGTRVLVTAPAGSRVVMSDAIGVLDTVRAQNGASLSLGSAATLLTARVKGSIASTSPGDSVVIRRILIIGEASWESKFVVVALEEEGWKVDAFIRVAPTVDVTQGSTAAIDTSRYAAVVALDAAAAPYANRIIDFARNGGGVVLGPAAGSVDAMSSLRAGVPGRVTPPVAAATGITSLALAPIVSLRSDAIPLERRNGAVAIAARRIGAGRSLQLGYQDTWRWRMGGGDDAVRDHREWWTGLVSSVAYAPRITRLSSDGVSDEAPVAALVAAIGPNTPVATLRSFSQTSSSWSAWLFALLALGLIGEVASRRLRGAS